MLKTDEFLFIGGHLHGRREIVAHRGEPPRIIQTRHSNKIVEYAIQGKLIPELTDGYFYAVASTSTEQAHAMLDQFLDAVNR